MSDARGKDLPQRRHDPARDLLDFMSGHARDALKSILPIFDVGEVLSLTDPDDGVIIQLDNSTAPVVDCVVPLAPDLGVNVGDRVLVLGLKGEFYVLQVLE